MQRQPVTEIYWYQRSEMLYCSQGRRAGNLGRYGSDTVSKPTLLLHGCASTLAAIVAFEYGEGNNMASQLQRHWSE